mgnify:CR=1 FL=1
MHRIQRTILSRLAVLGPSRYRDIKPKDIEGNLFTYHLNKLLSDKVVSRSSSLYSLTASGLQYVGQLSLATQQPRIQPKIVTLIACHNKEKQWLLYERSQEPFKGFKGFPYGKIHLGETVKNAAKRELKEKTGLSATINHVGEAYVLTYQSDELISHMLFHIFVAEAYSGQLVDRSEYGKFFWGKVSIINKENYFPGFAEVYSAISSKEFPFFIEVKKRL